MPWQRLEDSDLSKTRMRLRTVLKIFIGLVVVIALWLFGAWLAHEVLSH